MRVVHVGEYVSGGVATYLRVLIAKQIENPNIEEIVLFKSGYGSEELNFDSDKVRIINFKYRRSISGIITLLGLWSAIIRLQPDIVHLHSSIAGLLRLRNVGHKSPFKVIYCAHGWAFLRDSSRAINAGVVVVERLLAHGCDSIVNISPSEMASAIRYQISPSKQVLVENGIDVNVLSKGPSPKSGRLRLLFVGRFDHQKGVDILLNAAQELPFVDFCLVGASVLENEEFSNFPLSKNVKLLGWLTQADVMLEMQKSDAVIIPSRWEGFGLVALEAMKNGCAVLASNVGGLADIVQNNVNGFLFEPNSKDEIVHLIERLDRRTLSYLGSQGKKIVSKKYSASSMERRLYQLYVQQLRQE